MSDDTDVKSPPADTGAEKGGVSGKHPPAAEFSLLVAPTFKTDPNTLRMALIPVACWRLNDVRFDFDSSFVLPGSQSEFIELAQLRKDHPGAPLSVFGHADPVSDDTYNKNLSGRRAEAIYAVLIRDTARWEKLRGSATAGDDWGYSSTQHMLKALGHYPGPVTGSANAQSTAAVKEFQGKNGLTVDGDAGPKTREKLFLAYMDFLSPEKLQKSDFLAQGADAQGKGDFQGCSEFNPVMVFSQAESLAFQKTGNKAKRNEENSSNRRVMVLLFRPGTNVPPAKWPCPRASEGVSGCKARFWSDGELRRSNQAARREFADTKDTFACRFYHRLVISSPCEGGNVTPVVLLLKLLKVDDHFCPKQEMLDITYVLKGFSGKVVKVQISSVHAPQNPIFERELTPAEKTDGNHTIQWDGKGNVAAGDFKDRHIHPLFSPYKVTLVHDAVHIGTLEFKVLYHSIELKNGPFTPDEKEPPEAEDKRFAAFKLNELGYYGGPVEKDTEDYVKKAIIRYKANHQKLRKPFIGDYTDAIDADLKAALKAKEGDRKIPPFDAITDPAKKSVVPVEALTYERTGPSADEFGTTRPPHEKLRLNRPLIPCEAEIFIKKKDDSKALEPEAVGPVRVSWRAKDADEDLAPQFTSSAAEPSRTKEFIETTLKLHAGRTGNGDNCPVEFAGVRADAADHKTPFLLGDAYVPHDVKDDPANKAVFSLASVDKDKFPKRQGKAGVMFRPSFIAGDDYKFTAELDFTGLPNKADLEKFHGIKDEKTKIKDETGVFTVRRFNKVAMRIDWPKRAAPALHTGDEFDKVETEFKKAFNDVDVSKILEKKISEVLTADEYKAIVTANTIHSDPAKISLFDDRMVGVDVAVQGNRDADDYKLFLETFTGDDFVDLIQTPLGEKLSEVVRKTEPAGFIILNFLTHKPIDVKNDPANGDNTVTKTNTQHVNWSGSIGLPDSIVLVDQMDPDKVYYVVAHEMGHNFYLLHWENTGENNTANHDQNDHNCTMSYSDPDFADPGQFKHHEPGKYTPHFCGKCNLALRGWEVTSANMAEKSKQKGDKKGAAPPPIPIVTPKVKLEKKVVIVRNFSAAPKRRKVQFSADLSFSGSGTLTCQSKEVKFFTAQTAGAAVDLTGAGKSFTGAELKKGQELFVEGFLPSNTVDDVVINLTLTKGGDGKDVAGPAEEKLTSLRAVLDFFDEEGSFRTDVNKSGNGGVVMLRESDNSNRRNKIVVGKLQPPDFDATLVLSTKNSNIKLFSVAAPAAKDKDLGAKIEIKKAELPKTLFVEGATLSAAVEDTALLLDIKGHQDEEDRAFITVMDPFHMHVDADRDGKVDDDRTGLDKWEFGKGKKGAIILCNNDDDGGAGSPDNADNKINGGNDKDELAPLTIKRKGGASPPADWKVKIEVSAADADRIRIFEKRTSGAAEIIGPSTGSDFTLPALSFKELELGMEAVQYADASFAGEIDITFTLKRLTSIEAKEVARVRVAPWIMPNHLDPAEKVFVVDAGVHNATFIATLSSLLPGGVSLVQHPSNDIWMQDCLEFGHSSLPTSGFRSVMRTPREGWITKAGPNFGKSDRELKTFPVTLLKKDFGFHAKGPLPAFPTGSSTFNSGGNLETSPPCKVGGKDFPFGRIYFGPGRAGEEIDTEMTDFLTAQAVQKPFTIDTNWLLVGHVDEIVSFVPAPGGKGFKLLIASADLALKILKDNKAAHGSDKLLTGRDFPGHGAAEVTIKDFLDVGIPTLPRCSAARLATFNATAQTNLNGVRTQMKAELGLVDTDIIEVPVLFAELSVATVADALTAGMVNMLVLNKTCIFPKPFGPVVGGKDLFLEDLKGKLAGLGLSAKPIDDWFEYHVQLGEVHCGTNTLRKPVKTKWWEFIP